jgi:hypothetical protein
LFVSLGCDKNRVNLEQMMSLVQDAGHEITWEPEGACTARRISSRQAFISLWAARAGPYKAEGLK